MNKMRNEENVYLKTLLNIHKGRLPSCLWLPRSPAGAAQLPVWCPQWCTGDQMLPSLPAPQAAGLGLLSRRPVMATIQHLAPPMSRSFGGQRLGSGEAGCCSCFRLSWPNALTPPASTFPWRAGGRRGWLPPSAAAPSPPHGSPSCKQNMRQNEGCRCSDAHSSLLQWQQQRTAAATKQQGQLFQQNQREHPKQAHACTLTSNTHAVKSARLA